MKTSGMMNSGILENARHVSGFYLFASHGPIHLPVTRVNWGGNSRRAGRNVGFLLKESRWAYIKIYIHTHISACAYTHMYMKKYICLLKHIWHLLWARDFSPQVAYIKFLFFSVVGMFHFQISRSLNSSNCNKKNMLIIT